MVSTTSLAEFHEILQSAFGWSDEHLHRFLIQGVALLIQNALFRHASAEGEPRHRKFVLEPGIISSGWIGTKATRPSMS